jgi:hypothetical protein
MTDYKFSAPNVVVAWDFIQDVGSFECYGAKCEVPPAVDMTFTCNKTLTQLQAVAASKPAYSAIAATLAFAAP